MNPPGSVTYPSLFFLAMRSSMYTNKFIQRFWSKVDQKGVNDCWPWNAGITSRDYGQIHVRREAGKVINHKAHRVAYTLKKGPTNDLEVCHTCDNPPCCNPAHLFLGTHKENMDDRDKKGRQVVGQMYHSNGKAKCAKYSEETVKEIRRLYQEKTPKREISRRLGVPQTTVRHIIARRTWGKFE